MLTFRTDSWHRKLHDRIYCSSPPRSLCPYWWRLVLGVVLAPLWLLPSLTLGKSFGHSARESDLAKLILFSVLGVSAILATIALLGMTYLLATDWSTWAPKIAIIRGPTVLMVVAWRFWGKMFPQPEASEPGLFSSYAKATKDRVCPLLIEWTDAEVGA